MRPSRNSRWRALTLIAVHILVALHITQWVITGRTLSPVEPSEAMASLEYGELNAGFLFFAVALILTLVFGRFFCGWGCHVVALQDLSAAVMKRIGIRPRPFRSRLLSWVPLVVAFYMFVWPSFKRSVLFPILEAMAPSAIAGFQPVGEFQLSSGLMTEGFWDTFPPWTVAIPFLAICGFGTVYLLGSKAFCTYGCPYGAFFGALDRMSPGRILANLDHCEKCGHCTATCTSNVRIHEEIQVYSMVVDSGCMKCLDCVSVCPNDALSFGFGSPPFKTKAIEGRSMTRRYDLSWRQEFGLLGVFAFAFFATFGAYQQIPMLMALGIASCMTFLGYKLLQLLTTGEVRFHRTILRRKGSLRRAGRIFAAVAVVLFLLTIHTGYMRWSVVAALDDYYGVEGTWRTLLGPNPPPIRPEHKQRAAAARARLEKARPVWRGGHGLAPVRFRDPRSHHELSNEMDVRIARMHMVEGNEDLAVKLLSQTLPQRTLPDDRLCARLAHYLYGVDRTDEALTFLESVRERLSDSSAIRDAIVDGQMLSQRPDLAAQVYLEALAKHPGDALTRAKLASVVYLQTGQLKEGIRELERAISDQPDTASFHHNLGVAYLRAGRNSEAISAMERAVELEPENDAYRQNLEQMRKLPPRGRRPR